MPALSAGLPTSSAPACRLPPGRFAGVLALLMVLSWGDVLLGFGTFVLGDFNLFGFPLASHAKQSLLRGELPLWNPLNNCGLPFLAQWNTMVLYPPAWLNLLFPLSWWLGVFNLFHLYVGGLGVYLLARRETGSDLAGATAGVAWAFGGLAQSSLMWPNNSAALGLLPWVLLTLSDALAGDGRRRLIAVAVGSLQMLAGAPEIVIFTWLLAVFEWLLQRKGSAAEWVAGSAQLGVIAVGISLVCAVQLLPFLDLLWHSQRAGEYPGAEWAVGPFVWGNYVVPLFRTVSTSAGVHYQVEQFWLVSSYAGVGTLLLAVMAGFGGTRVALWRWLLVLVFLVLAMGRTGMLHPLLTGFLPVGAMRYPAKFLVPVSFLLPLLAAAGVARWERKESGRGLPVGLLVMGGLFVLTLALIRPLTPAGEDVGVVWLNAVGRLGFLVLVLFGLRLLASEKWSFLGICGLLLATWGDLRTQQPHLTPVVSRAVYDDENPTPPPGAGGRAMLSAKALGELRQRELRNPADTAVLQRLSRFDNLNLPDGVAKVDGFWSLYLPAEQHVEGLIYLGPNGVREPLADFCAVTQLSDPENIFRWRSRANAMPLVTGGQRVIPVPDEEVLARLAAPDFDPRREVFLATEGPLSGDLQPGSVTVADLRRGAHEWRFQVTAAAPAIVVVAQAYHHNWRAEVNGVATPVLRANHAFQAISVPAGSSEIRLYYRDGMLTLGGVISVVALGLLAVGWRISGRRNGEPRPSAG